MEIGKKIAMSETNPDAYLEIYARNDGRKQPAVLIYPGGAYRFLSEHEGNDSSSYAFG